MKNKAQAKKVLISLLVVVVALGTGFFVGQKYDSASKNQTIKSGKYVPTVDTVVAISHTEIIPKGWVKKNYAKWGFSVAVPSGWLVTEPRLVDGVTFTNPQDRKDTINFSYNYPGLASASQTVEERANDQLYDVFPIYIAGEKGFRGVFTNAALWLAQNDIYIMHNGVTYDISFPSEPSNVVEQIINSFGFN